MFATYGYPTVRRPINTYQITTPLDIAWKVTWPLLVTNIIAGAMVICFIIIAALEVASLAKSTSKSQYGNTSSTGAGFWCGIFFLIAAVLIFLMNFTIRIRIAAMIALIGTIIAACFSIIILGLDAKAVEDGKNIQGSLQPKTQVLAAQLAFSIFEFLLCLAFIAVYIAVVIIAPRRLYQPRPVMYY